MVLTKEKDRIIKDSEAKFYFSYLEWDSHFFSRPSYYLNSKLSHLKRGSSNIGNQIRSQLDGCFVTAKIDTSFEYEVIKTLQDSGFYYVETEIKLEYQKKQSSQRPKAFDQNIEVCRLNKNTDIPSNEIGAAFQNTRFHTDLNIPKKKADDLWISYLKNYTPDDNHFMYVAKIDNKISGVILVNKDNIEVFLFYVAVIADFQGMGVGTRLIHHVTNQFDEYTITTGTQAKNIQAINYYIKNDFSKILSAKTVLHRW